MLRFSSLRAWLAGLLLLGAVVLACSSTSTTGLPPVTGIIVRADTLIAGKGCGRGPTQVLKYAVLVNAAPDRSQPVTANLFDCFTDGIFISVPGGDRVFYLDVFAYNEPAFAAKGADIQRLVELDKTSPTWTTTCTATQQQNVQTLANCEPLTPGLGGLTTSTQIALETARFTLPDGRVALCADADAGVPDASIDAESQDAGDLDASAEAAVDGGEDATVDAAVDAAEGGAHDAGPPVSFSTGIVRIRIGPQILKQADFRCPNLFVTDVTSHEPLRYEVDVGLLDPSGQPVGQLTCSATTQPGQTSTAVCP